MRRSLQVPWELLARLDGQFRMTTASGHGMTNAAFGRETTKCLELGFEWTIELVRNGSEAVQLNLKRIIQRDPASFHEQRACETVRIAVLSA